MGKLVDQVVKIRSKNAGPFWVTVDIFCGTAEAFEKVRQGLSASQLAGMFKVPEADLKRFDLEDLNVIKISFPRPVVQGSTLDRDQHGAQYAVLLQALEIV